jgi:fibronectin-binding autotransporter adhesin
MTPPHNRPRLQLSLSGLAFLLSCSPLTAATLQWDGGAGSGDWQTAANWNPDALNIAFNGSYVNRLNVNGAQTLIYSAAEGSTVYSENRGLVVGSGASGAGSMRITGGTFSILGSVASALIGNQTTGTSSLTIDGGTFIGNALPFLINFGLSGTNAAVLNVNSGTANIPLIRFSSSDSGGVTTGTGTLNLTGGTLTTNKIDRVGSASAVINFNGGTLRAGAASTTFLAGLNSATVNAGAVIDTNGFDITIGQALLAGTGAGTLDKNSAGKLTLTGANTYTGITTISAGTLELGNGGASGSIASGNIVNNATFTINRTGDLTLSNVISGSGEVNKLASGFTTLSGSNTYTGATAISGGAIIATGDGALGTAAAGTSVATGAALALSGGVNYATAEALTISGPGITAASAPFTAVQRGALQALSGANTWAGNITFTNTTNTRIGVQDGASLTINGSITEQTAGSSIAFRHGNTAGSNILINGTNSSWSGFTDIFGGGGAVILGTNNALSPSAILRVGTSGIPGTTMLDLNGFNQTATGLTQVVLNTPATITNGAAATTSTLKINGATDGTYPATLADGAGFLALEKDGTSTLTLSGNNSTYSGGTVINGGRVLANNTANSATGTGNVTVNPGATFGGTGAITGSVITTSGSFLSPGASIESLSIGGASGAGTLVIEYDGAAGSPIDLLSVTGSLNIATMTLDAQMLSGGAPLSAPSYIFANYGSLIGTFASATVPSGYTLDYQFGGTNQIAFVQIPEPTAAILALLSASCLMRRRRIQR